MMYDVTVAIKKGDRTRLLAQSRSLDSTYGTASINHHMMHTHMLSKARNSATVMFDIVYQYHMEYNDGV